MKRHAVATLPKYLQSSNVLQRPEKHTANYITLLSPPQKESSHSGANEMLIGSCLASKPHCYPPDSALT